MFDPNSIFVQGFILSTGIIGQFYVSHMNKAGFYWWISSNIALITVSLYFHSYGMVGLYLFFAVMCFYSIYQWNRRQPKVEYRTVDGGHLAPYPDMTDRQLYEFEYDMKVPCPTFKYLPEDSLEKALSSS